MATQPKTATVANADLKSLLSETMSDFAGVGQTVSADAKAVLDQAAETLAPLAASEMQLLLDPTTADRAQSYLDGLRGIVTAKLAGIALEAMAESRDAAVEAALQAVYYVVKIAAGTLKIAAFA